MKHTYKLAALAGVFACLSGCGTLTGDSGYFRDKSGDYVDETVAPNLLIPANLKSVKPVEFMVIPPAASKAAPSRDDGAPRSDRRVVREDGSIYEVITENNRSLLIVNRPPQLVWPFLTEFWDDNDISVETSDPAQKVIVTDWVQLGDTSKPGFMRRLVGTVIDLENADTSQEKFRLSLQPGRTGNSSRIVLEHVRRRDGSDLTQPVDWQSERSPSPMLENTLLSQVLVHLVQNREKAVIHTSDRLNIDSETSLQSDGNGNPVLRIDQSFARTWQAVEMALRAMKINVTDKDRSLGLIYINVGNEQVLTAPKAEKGWFDGLFGGSEDEAEKVAASMEYSVRIQSQGNTTSVTLEKDLNTSPPANRSKAFLEHLRENLQ